MSKTYKATYTPAPVTVELSAQEANNIAIQRICDVSNWKRDWYLTQSVGVHLAMFTYVTERIFAHTTHSFSYETTIREATPEDISTFKMIEKLKNL
jgi:hypothetical protein